MILAGAVLTKPLLKPAPLFCRDVCFAAFCGSGVIPADLGRLTNLTMLNLSWNSLSGEQMVDYTDLYYFPGIDRVQC